MKEIKKNLLMAQMTHLVSFGPVFVGLLLSNNGLPTRVCSEGGSVCHVGCTE